MNVLIASPFAINTPHFETELEIAQNHIDAGDNIKILYCDGDLFACDVNADHNIPKCLICIDRRKRGIQLLSQKIETLRIVQSNLFEINEFVSLKKEFANFEELKKFTINNFDIGYAVLSSLVSFSREPSPNTIYNQDLIYRLLLSSLVTYKSTDFHLLHNNIDRLYVFNGRYGPLRGIFRACQKNNVTCFLIERGSTLNHYSLYENELPHDIANTTALINNLWDKASNIEKRDEQASNFFLNKIRNISPTWIAFTKDQKEGLLPTNWDNKKENIVLFLSSEDEFVAIGDKWENKFYDTQTEGITRIASAFKDDHNIHLYLRVHPNLINVKNKQTEEIKLLNFPNLTVIPAESPISTYAVMQNASKVVTFGSSVGVEATYWGRPSILAGPSFYQNLQCTYNPQNHNELIDMLRSKLSPINKKGALKYGYYFQTFGIPFKYYKAKAIKKGSFKGVELNKSRFLLGLYIVLKILFPLDKLFTYIDMLRLRRKILKST